MKLSAQQITAMRRVDKGQWDAVPPTTLRSLVRNGLITYTPKAMLTDVGRRELETRR